MSRTVQVLATNAREAADSLCRARLRTALGLVGVMIGISSVIAMVSLGEVAKEQARKQFEALGTDIVVVRKSSAAGRVEIGLPAALKLAPEVPSIVEAAPRISGSGTFRFAGREVGRGAVQGITRSFASVNKLTLQEGRFISNLDTDRYWSVVGAEVADKMRAAGTDRLLGTLIEVDEVLFTVVGVLNRKAESSALPFQVAADKSVFVPITTVRRITPDLGIEFIVARSATGVHHETAVEDIRSYFRKRAPDLGLNIVTAKELIDRMEAQMDIFTHFLGAVGSISLIVGGIGIMNIMLVSVAERRAEIAIRRALGARQRDIKVSLRGRPPVVFAGDRGDFALGGGRAVSVHQG